MLIPEPMHEVSLFVLEPDLETVTAAIAHLEVLHIEDSQPEAWTPAGEWTRLAGNYHNLAQRLESLLKSLEIRADGIPFRKKLQPSYDWRELEAQVTFLEGRIKGWQQHFDNLRQEREQLELARVQLTLLSPLKMPVEELRDLKQLRLLIGTMPAENLPRLGEALFQIPFVLVPLETEKGRSLLVAATSYEHAAIFERALKSGFFEPIELPAIAQGSPQEALTTLEQQLSTSRQELTKLQNERAQLVDELGSRLVGLWQRVRGNASLAEAIRRFPCHGEVYLLAGWVPARRLDELSQTVREVADNQVVIEVLTPRLKRQGVPTLLSIPRWLRPFADLVTIYGLPGYQELDPTLIAAPIFLLMYGMMFGDLGQGFLLIMLGLALRWRGGRLGVVVSAAGFSGALFGLLYGTFFGLEILPPLWLRPMDHIAALLITAIVGGVVLLNIGFVLNLVSTWRSSSWARFFLDKNGLLGLALYWVLLGGGLAVARGVLSTNLWLLLLLIPSLLLWLREPLSRRLWSEQAAPLSEVMVTGFFELFEAIISYASNSLSFVRLGAFAVAHEGLSRMVLQYSTGSGGWLIFVLGTMLIVGFEGVIVGIQALRLEYYEFFGRFFRGEGKSYVPLSLKGGRDAQMGVRI